MISSSRTEKVVSKHCSNCSGQLPARDNFCRWCGFHLGNGSGPASEMAGWYNQKTAVLTDGDLKSFSTTLINTMQQNTAAKTGSLRLNRFGVLVIAVLMGIPMWLHIILMSPLYAYAAAKAASSQMSIE